MTAPRHLPPAPLGPDGPYLAAILDVLDGIAAMLDDRLPTRNGGPVPGCGPAPKRAPGKAIPIREPAPDGPPDEDDPPPDPPPRAGRGASGDAWRTWAAHAGVTVPDSASRDDIIAACEQAGVLTAKT